jgi:hypothetical protein
MLTRAMADWSSTVWLIGWARSGKEVAGKQLRAEQRAFFSRERGAEWYGWVWWSSLVLNGSRTKKRSRPLNQLMLTMS